MAPLIGLTTRQLKTPNSSSAIIGAGERYIKAIKSAGGVPLLIPLDSTESEVGQILSQLDGVLLSGGEDIDPRHYGEAPIEQIGEISAPRDKTELALARLAFERNLPLLGICRGLQVANVALGGSLYQDIATQVAGALTHTVDKWEELSHPIKLESDSKLERILGGGPLAVNSLHHQAAKLIAPQLHVTARASDGIVEALEAPSRDFFICVQAHPEALWEKIDKRWAKLFSEFIIACTNN